MVDILLNAAQVRSAPARGRPRLQTRLPVRRRRPGKLLVGTAMVVAAGALSVPFLGAISRWFVPLSLADVATAFGIMAAYVVTTDVAKRLVFRGRSHSQRAAGEHG